MMEVNNQSQMKTFPEAVQILEDVAFFLEKVIQA